MEEVTCPNCNVDITTEELRKNFLRCPTCGFDISEAEDTDDILASDVLDEDEEDEEVR
jgi:uncharacterized protein (DUF983 family)